MANNTTPCAVALLDFTRSQTKILNYIETTSCRLYAIEKTFYPNDLSRLYTYRTEQPGNFIWTLGFESSS